MTDLRRDVAIACGWTVRQASNSTGDEWHELLRPDGTLVRNPEWLPSSEYATRFRDEYDAWATAPTFDEDIAACIVELDRVCGDSTCRAWRIENSKWEWVERKRYYVCEIIDCDEMAGSETGATAAEAACKAIIKWRKWEAI